MIVDWFLDRGQAVIMWLVGLMPAMDLDFSALCDYTPAMGWMECVVPISHLGIVLGIILSVELAVWVVRAVVWVWDRLPLT